MIAAKSEIDLGSMAGAEKAFINAFVYYSVVFNYRMTVVCLMKAYKAGDNILFLEDAARWLKNNKRSWLSEVVWTYVAEKSELEQRDKKTIMQAWLKSSRPERALSFLEVN